MGLHWCFHYSMTSPSFQSTWFRFCESPDWNHVCSPYSTSQNYTCPSNQSFKYSSFTVNFDETSNTWVHSPAQDAFWKNITGRAAVSIDINLYTLFLLQGKHYYVLNMFFWSLFYAFTYLHKMWKKIYNMFCVFYTNGNILTFFHSPIPGGDFSTLLTRDRMCSFQL